MIGRRELKFYINHFDYIQLRTRLRVIAKPDINGSADNGYIVRSLYFDNYFDKVVFDKLSGQSNREKFRIRYYNADVSFIRLEKKSKANKLVGKENALITAEQCGEILLGNYDCLKLAEVPLMMELYTKIRTQNLRPRNIVEYRREAYTFRAGNVRITLDSRVKTSDSVRDFLSPKLVSVPATIDIVMEVKYDGFLPDVIQDLIQIDNRNQAEFSKYVVSRLL